jgi:hypothetical protein
MVLDGSCRMIESTKFRAGIARSMLLVVVIVYAVGVGCAKKNVAVSAPPYPAQGAFYQGSLDVNHDGVVDARDLQLLKDAFIEVMKNRVEPLLIKAGIGVAADGHLDVTGTAQEERIRTRLTPAEQKQLAEARRYAGELQQAVYRAAAAIAFK